ncbi:MAG TPA: hypothetical protein VIJ34_00520 [Acidimicrobiales bacterium]
MSDRSRSNTTFVVVQALWGATLLAAPGTVLLLLGGADEDRTPKRIMRVLGARHLVQAVAEQQFGDLALRVGACVDALHALTGFGFACADARWRRAALADAMITSGFAAVGLSEVRAGSN